MVILHERSGDACLAKPYRSVDLVRGLEIVSEIIATGTALPPFPRGFQVLQPARPSGDPTTAQQESSHG